LASTLHTVNDAAIPLCLDLDGTLTPVDTLHEGLLNLARTSPISMLALPGWLNKGKARFKSEISALVDIDVPSLPFRPELLEWLKSERVNGRTLVLATAADRAIADAVANHLGLFDEVVASDGTVNLSGEAKRQALVKRFGEKGFDYAGNDAGDAAVWKSSRRAIVVGAPALVNRARRVAEVERVFDAPSGGALAWLKAARLQQWVKNGLIFVPQLLAHKILQPDILVDSLLAFLAFGMCASSVYLANDLLDLVSDRQHPRKRQRPFASGKLSARSGLLAGIALLCASMLLAALINLKFCALLAGYYATTWAYSLRLKRFALVDVMTLAGLYTVRIIAGAAVTAIALSFWLLAFSVFIFLSLGFVKRYTELNDVVQAGRTGNSDRGYRPSDLPLLLALGTAAGYCTVLVMALYINSPDSQALYSHSQPLWLACPLLLYWISHVWLLTTRGQMHDDPIVFALRDRTSLLVLGLLGLIAMVAV
jgi:4-hydroxybenzoate polyprenyltransferase/phosphoserine phosphatase